MLIPISCFVAETRDRGTELASKDLHLHQKMNIDTLMIAANFVGIHPQEERVETTVDVLAG